MKNCVINYLVILSAISNEIIIDENRLSVE